MSFVVISYLIHFRPYIDRKIEGDSEQSEVKREPTYHNTCESGVHWCLCEEDCWMISETSIHLLEVVKKTRIRSISSRGVKRSEIQGRGMKRTSRSQES